MRGLGCARIACGRLLGAVDALGLRLGETLEHKGSIFIHKELCAIE